MMDCVASLWEYLHAFHCSTYFDDAHFGKLWSASLKKNFINLMTELVIEK